MATLTETLPAATPSAARPATRLPAIIQREQRRHRRRIIAWSSVLGVLPLLAFAGWLVLRPRPVPMAARFHTAAVTRGDLVREVRATGHTEAFSTVSVGAEISGRIAEVRVDYNDRVRAGQVLAVFDRTSLSAQRAQTAATLAAARAAEAEARHDLEQARRNLTRADALHARGAQTDAEHDNFSTAAALAAERFAATQAQRVAQEAAFAVARTNLDHSVIRSPIDGVVITRNVDPGQTVASVLASPTLFTVAADLREMKVVAAVDEADIGEVAVGQRASFTVNAYPDRTFDGVVTEVRNSPVIVQDVVTYGTVIELANPDLALKPGMTASVRVRTASATDTARVPSTALQFTPPGEAKGAGAGVWILDGETLRRVPVQAGISNGELTAIGSGALPAGAQVLVELSPEGKKLHGSERAR